MMMMMMMLVGELVVAAAAAVIVTTTTAAMMMTREIDSRTSSKFVNVAWLQEVAPSKTQCLPWVVRHLERRSWNANVRLLGGLGGFWQHKNGRLAHKATYVNRPKLT